MYLERKCWTGARGPVVISALGIDPARKWAKRKLLANLARLTIRDTQGIGAEVQLDYQGTAIRSGPVKAEVLSPEGEEIETSFDLATLR
jgi:hypothetical protein